MKTRRKRTTKSLPELRLCEIGTNLSYDILFGASQLLLDAELKSLEEELSFYTRTGLIGVRMSKILARLQIETSAKAAREKCLALIAKRAVSSQTLPEGQAAA